jgi:xylulokinase
VTFLGIDLGTSGVKVLLVDEKQERLAEATAALDVQRPEPLWSEQNPEAWWQATEEAVARIREVRPAEFAAVAGIGLSGQMHGATFLDASDRALRPAILWNDGRSAEECLELESREPRSREITGNLAMPGFTAPKMLWLSRYEPEIAAQVARVLLPKDYLRLRMTGEAVSDPSDAAGTLWLDVAQRTWSAEMLAASRLDERAMPRLCEGSEASATLRPEVAAAWGLQSGVVVAGGGGDNAAGAVGAGVIRAGDALLSLGTSGVYFVAGDSFAPNPERAVHAFCHCLPGAWHQMSVILSAASCLTWVSSLTRARDEAALLAEVEAADRDTGVLFLPYLSGERTPHNDPNATGVFFGLNHETTRADLGRAVLEGVAFALADGQDALMDAGTDIGTVTVIGGGARSHFWGGLLAAALDRALDYAEGAERGPAFGAARLGRLAFTGEDPAEICRAPRADRRIEPEPSLVARYAERRAVFGSLYERTRGGLEGRRARDFRRGER